MNHCIEKIRSDTFLISPEELLGSIVSKDDFVEIQGKIEPTRGLALKLFTATKIDSYTVELQQVINRENETVYITKATVSRQGKKSDGLGACSTIEVEKRGNKTRAHHDALATAETRAYKRAIEGVVGLPFINEIILKLFGSYESKKVKSPSIEPDEFIHKISEAKALPHLKNVWEKYKHNLNDYKEDERKKIIIAKNLKKEDLKNDLNSRNNKKQY